MEANQRMNISGENAGIKKPTVCKGLWGAMMFY